VSDSPYIQVAREAASRHGIDPDIYVKQIMQESGFNPRATSPAGAQGIAQFMPGNAQGLGLKDPYDPVSALDAGAKHMAALLRNLGSYPLALAGYNAGGGAVKKYGGIPPYKETQNYVKAILGTLDPASVASNVASQPSAQAAAPMAAQAVEPQSGNALQYALMSLLSGDSRITPWEDLIR
jgi:soluble lytic murein transglycosylase-like protein